MTDHRDPRTEWLLEITPEEKRRGVRQAIGGVCLVIAIVIVLIAWMVM